MSEVARNACCLERHRHAYAHLLGPGDVHREAEKTRVELGASAREAVQWWREAVQTRHQIAGM